MDDDDRSQLYGCAWQLTVTSNGLFASCSFRKS